MKPGLPILLGLLILSPAAGRAAEGYRVYESTAASVNGEVLFVSDVAREAASRMAACPSPCQREIAPGETREWVRRKLLLRDFFNRRVGVFVEVKDDDVRRELARRSSAPGNGAKPTLEEVRDEMLDARIAQEIRNWQTRAASKSRLILSPMEGR